MSAKYKAALQSCKIVAREEYPCAQDALDRAKRLVGRLRNRMETIRTGATQRQGAEAKKSLTALAREAITSRSGTKQQGTASSEAQEKLAELSRVLNEIVTKELENTSETLARKKDHLEKFTVTLFGRTMAGKSTIREAITRGDGSTIGKGAPRTTRCIREYEWNHLRIIDTPGIGAYKGEADSALARSVIDESDVLIFLASSDGIQESSFREMRKLRDQNKPVIFVLNVMQDLSHPVYRRRFLKSPSKFMGEKAIKGHKSRIRGLASDELGMRDVIIVPVHAQAAFLATRPEYASDNDILYQASGMDGLMNVLTNEVLRRGTVRRLQTLLDGTIVQLMDLEKRLRDEARSLHRGAKHLKDEFTELDSWLDGYIDSTNERIEYHASEVLRSLRDSVSTFTDENIEREDVEIRWTKKVESVNIGKKMESFQKQVLDEARGHLDRFNQQVVVDYKLREEINIEGPAQYDPWDVKRTLRRTSAIAAVGASAAGIAAWISASNFWNPVGWIAGGVSIAIGALSWLFDDREEKLQRQKSQAAKQLRTQIGFMEQDIVELTKKWFDDNVTGSLVRGVRKETRQLYGGMFELSKAFRDAASTCAKDIEALNHRLLLRCGALVREDVAEESILAIARDPGIKTKFICADGAASSSFCMKVGKALGEWIDIVEQGPFQKMITAALCPARIDPNKVEEQAAESEMLCSRDMYASDAIEYIKALSGDPDAIRTFIKGENRVSILQAAESEMLCSRDMYARDAIEYIKTLSGDPDAIRAFIEGESRVSILQAAESEMLCSQDMYARDAIEYIKTLSGDPDAIRIFVEGEDRVSILQAAESETKQDAASEQKSEKHESRWSKEINFSYRKTIVRVPASQMGRAIGKNGSNVRLAARLMKTRIQLQEED